MLELGAKRAELVQLMQKFLPRSRIGIFRNECTQSTPLAPKLMFWCVLYCLDAFWIVLSLHDARYKTGWTGATNAKLRSTKSHRNFFAMNGIDPPNWTLNSCFGASRSVWVHLAMFHYYTKLGANWVELVQLMHKFVSWSRFGIFRNECPRTTPLDPKLMFCCVS